MDQPASFTPPSVESTTALDAPLADSRDGPFHISTSKEQQQQQQLNQPDAQQSSLKRSKTTYIVSPPRYVRTQTLGLQRSSTAATLSGHVKPAIVLPPTPRTPVDVEEGTAPQQHNGGDASGQKGAPGKRRVSVGFPQRTAAAAGPAGTAELPRKRPLKRRSDSLPTIPGVTDDVQKLSSSGAGSAADAQPDGAAASVSATQKSMIFQPGSHTDVSSLPTDPKTWNSRQLAVYLAHVLKLQPSAIRADVQRLVVKSGLTGKRFLRMQHDDLLGLGINIAWCRIFATARDRLRRECLRGKIFGTSSPTPSETSETSPSETPAEGERDLLSYFLRPPGPQPGDDEGSMSEWKQNSWRRKEGKKSRGRVKGIAHAFEMDTGKDGHALAGRELREQELEEMIRERKARSRQSSTDSEASKATASTVREHGGDYSAGSGRRASSDAESEEASVVIVTSDRSSSEDDDLVTPLPTPPIAVDWSSVEPITLEETSALPGSILEQAQSSEITPPASHAPTDPALPAEEPAEADAAAGIHSSSCDADYQSRILLHGKDAYSAIRRPSISAAELASPAGTPVKKHSSQMSEPTDELSAEHLAYWLNEQQQQRRSPVAEAPMRAKRSPLPSPMDIPKSSSVPSILEESYFSAPPIDAVRREEKADEMDSASLSAFAENDGNIATVKQATTGSVSRSAKSIGRPRSHSNGNLGSLRLRSVASRSSRGTGNAPSLANLFDHRSRDAGSAGTGETAIDGYIGIEDGRSEAQGMVMMSRAELEQMQSRMKDLELQLAASRSASTPVSLSHSQSTSTDSDSPNLALTDSERSRAMSEWARSALGEANGFVVNARDKSWVGLGGWALAAGLGIGLVIGENVLGKIRR